MKLEGLKRIRKEKNMTQEELANKIGVKRAVISKYESGAVSPTIDQLNNIAQALEVPLGALVYGDTETLLSNVSVKKKTEKEAEVSIRADIRRAPRDGTTMTVDEVKKLANQINYETPERRAQVEALFLQMAEFVEMDSRAFIALLQAMAEGFTIAYGGIEALKNDTPNQPGKGNKEDEE